MEAEVKHCPCCRRNKSATDFEEGDKRCAKCRGAGAKRVAKQKAKKPAPADRLELRGEAISRGVGNLPHSHWGEKEYGYLLEAVWDLREVAVGDPAKFFEFAIRDERTGKPLLVCPHQQIVFEFIRRFPRCVIRTPINTHKSFTVTSWLIWLLAKEPSWRGLVMSSTQDLANRAIRMVSTYIDEPQRADLVRFVFPGLRKTQRIGVEPWRQTEITVDRPPGMRDASLVALGAQTKYTGPRAEFAVVDDLVTHENSYTEELRRSTKETFWNNVESRVDGQIGRIVVINTPWDPEDLTYQLEKQDWPTITMDVYGNVRLSNCPPAFGADHLVSSDTKSGWQMLKHLSLRKPEARTICDIIYPPSVIKEKELKTPPHSFARWFLCEPMAEGVARCQREWIMQCKKPGLNLVHSYKSPNPIYTGVDIAFGEGKESDRSAFATFELLPGKRRRLLWLESGQWTGPEIYERVIDHHNRYGSYICVEHNVGQKWLKQFLDMRGQRIRIRAHHTSPTNKYNLDFGVESIFDEFRENLWDLPAREDGQFDSELWELLFKECLLYRPARHCGDRLMALWIAREGCRVGGGGRDPRARALGRYAMAGGAPGVGGGF